MLPFSKNTEAPATPAAPVPAPRTLGQTSSSAREVPAAYIGEGVDVKGNMNVPGAVVVDGSFSGDITAQDITVGKSGQVSGQVRGQQVSIHGRADQQVVAERLIVHATGMVTGKVEYVEIEIVRGGLIDGAIVQRSAHAPDDGSGA